ncbi:hypothetical protein [Methanobrevibacter sp.]
MSCVAAQEANSTDLTVQDPTDDAISPLSETPEVEISEASNDIEDLGNDTVKLSTSKNTNSDDKLATANNDEPLSIRPEGHTFIDIERAINLTLLGGVIELERGITYTGSTSINVHHSVTINGNGAILDAHGIPLIFRIHESNVTINNITFINCRAILNGGAVYWTGDNGKIVNCNFINNTAGLNGGAIYLSASNCIVDNCNFINNTAYEGGAIYCDKLLISPENNTISNCNFTDNKAQYEGGAIYLTARNCKIDNCNFTNNTSLGDDGGAIYCGELLISPENNTISNCNFTDNTAKYNGGAIYLNADSSNITNCFFDDNTAEGNGGAIYLEANNCKIDKSGFTENTGVYGGAVFCGDPVNDKENNTLSNCIFTDNTAEKEGGALYIMESYTTLDLDYFNNNVAAKGSAIYINHASEFINVSNTEFDRNTADGWVSIGSIDGDETYALANVTVNAYLEGNDNIANAIWNNGETTSIQLYNITCEFSKDGKGRSLKKFNMDGFENPTDGFEDESKIWQSSFENAQLIDILVTDENGNVVLNITNGIDSTPGKSENGASPSDDTNLVVTDTIGKISVTIANLKAGKYTVLAKHEDDQYYTADEDSDTFVIYELKVTKTSEKAEYDIDEEVKYTIVVNNTGNSNISDVTIVENFPEEFYIDAYSLDESLGNNSLWQHDGDTFVYQQVLHPHEVVTLVLGLFTYKNGTNITNSITVSSNITDARIVESNNITVYRPSIEISKTAVNSTVYIGDQAVFIINVTNNGDRPLKAKDTIISEWFINELIYDHISAISGEWSVEDLEEGLFILDSALDIGESASFKIYFNTTELGEYENTIYGWYAKEPVGDTVTVIQIPTHISVENVTAYPGMNVTIHINVTTDDNKAFSGNVTIEFPDGSNQTVEIIEGNGKVKWFVLENHDTGIYKDTVRYSGNDIYLASTGNGTITVLPKISIDIVVSNETAYPDSDVTVSINVTADDGTPFNGEVNVIMPDGSTKPVKIVDGVASTALQLSHFNLLSAKASTIGTGTADWHVPASFAPGNYSVSVEFDGNDKYLAANGSGNIEVIPIPTETKVSNVTGKAGKNVVIPIKVTSDNNKAFNGIVSVTLPDGSTKTAKIVDGSGEVSWSIPKNYDGTYKFSVNYPGNDTFLPSNDTGFITVIPDDTPDDNDSVTPNDYPVGEINKTQTGKTIETQHKEGNAENKNLSKNETGNPILVLLAVLALLCVSIKRKK